MHWRTRSLEGRLARVFCILFALQLAGCGLLLNVFPLWQLGLIALLSGAVTALCLQGLRRDILASFRRASMQLDALQNEDYSLFARPVFSLGAAAELQAQLHRLGESLQQHKSYYDQQSFLLYRLIDQLNTPILVFDQRLQLSYANAAFAELFGRPWQLLRHAPPALLGLQAAPEWQFVDAQKSQQWQIRTSQFFDQGDSHQLLVFINIQTALRENQNQAWKKLIRVLSHEIRNSLTPVAALTQNLLSKAGSQRDQQALAVINERCQHLQDFVSRYAELHKPLPMQLQWLDVSLLYESLRTLFPSQSLRAEGLPMRIWADPVLLEQVLINLIKNAIEAGSPAGTVELSFVQGEQYSDICIADCGRGIANPDNLFVPFYTTKVQGQGIGLSVSRQIIEQMGGLLNLSNREQQAGALAKIRLPRPAE